MATMTTERVPSEITTSVVVTCVIFPILSLASIILRYMARRTGRLKLQSDDWWILASWIATFSLSINAWVYGRIIGFNYLKIDPLIGTSKTTQGNWVQGVLLQPCLTFVKISILLFYKRIFSTPRFTMAVWAAIAILGAWGFIYEILIIFQGVPVSTAWTGKGHFRFNPVSLDLSQAGTSICLDLLALCLPMPVLATLHMPAQRKVAVGMILWLGGFCCIAAIVRLVLLTTVLNKVADTSGFSNIVIETKAYIFGVVEPNCSIVAACLPCYGPLFSGGRTAESLVASVRSVLSIASGRSQRSRGSDSNRPRKANGYNAQTGNPKTESQIELHQLSNGWSQSASGEHNSVSVETMPYGGHVTLSSTGGYEIAVTKTYGISGNSV